MIFQWMGRFESINSTISHIQHHQHWTKQCMKQTVARPGSPSTVYSFKLLIFNVKWPIKWFKSIGFDIKCAWQRSHANHFSPFGWVSVIIVVTLSLIACACVCVRLRPVTIYWPTLQVDRMALHARWEQYYLQRSFLSL